MNRMLELIREEAVPAPILKKALSGQLAVPAVEQLEILVFLAARETYAAEAHKTLAAWDDESVCAVCSDPNTPRSVLRYFVFHDSRRRPVLLRSVVQFPWLDEETLATVAGTGTQAEVEVLLDSRASSMESVLQRIVENVRASEEQKVQCRRLLDGALQICTDSGIDNSAESQEALSQYFEEHEAEIASEEGKRFELTRGQPDEQDEIAELLEAVVAPGAASVAATDTRVVKSTKPEDRERLSVLQKIARLTVGERVQLAMKGNKDERFVLIRDGSRVVSLAVLESPKLTDTEVESFAAMKNVQEVVLRGIASKRKFMKKYAVVRALVVNPKTPLDLGLNLVPHLLSADLKNLSANKNVGETLRKVALKLWRDRQKK